MTYHRPHCLPRIEGDRKLVTRAIAARLARIPERSVRHYTEAVACDVVTRSVLVDLDDVDRMTELRALRRGDLISA